MNTSHQNGGAPDVFLKLASDAIRSDLQELERATSGVRFSIAALHNPEIDEDFAESMRYNHDQWHRHWCRASKRLMKQEKAFNNRRHSQLEM